MADEEYYAQSWRQRDKRRLTLLVFIFLANAAVGVVARNMFVAHLAQAVAVVAIALLIELILARRPFATRPFLRLSNDGLRYIACNIKWDLIREAKIIDVSRQVVVETVNDERLAQIVPPKLAKLLRANMRSTGCALAIPALKGVEPEDVVLEINQYRERSHARTEPSPRQPE